MKRHLAAFSVYVLGIVLAISAAAKVPAPGHTWPDTMPMFLAGVLVCLVGLAAWRISLRTAKNDSAGDGQSVETLFGHLHDARREAEAIARQWDRLDSESLRQRIDRLLLDFIAPFVESRDVVIQRYGMRQGAEVVLALALAERNFNRVWSAAADDCLPEAHTSLLVALDAMDELSAKIQALSSKI